jgi:hypothetical protein
MKLDVIRPIAGRLWRITAVGKPRRVGDQIVQTIEMREPKTEQRIGKDQ